MELAPWRAKHDNEVRRATPVHLAIAAAAGLAR
jgi:hypothetical protein